MSEISCQYLQQKIQTHTSRKIAKVLMFPMVKTWSNSALHRTEKVIPGFGKTKHKLYPNLVLQMLLRSK